MKQKRRIFNLDETMYKESSNTRVMCQSGQPVSKLNSGKQFDHVTFVPCVSVDGNNARPMLICTQVKYIPPAIPKGQFRMSTILLKSLLQIAISQSPFPDTYYVGTKKGYTTQTTFFTHIELIADDMSASIENPILILLDNHSSRFNADKLQSMADRGVYIWGGIPNSTHCTQMLDQKPNLLWHRLTTQVWPQEAWRTGD